MFKRLSLCNLSSVLDSSGNKNISELYSLCVRDMCAHAYAYSFAMYETYLMVRVECADYVKN